MTIAWLCSAQCLVCFLFLYVTINSCEVTRGTIANHSDLNVICLQWCIAYFWE